MTFRAVEMREDAAKEWEMVQAAYESEDGALLFLILLPSDNREKGVTRIRQFASDLSGSGAGVIFFMTRGAEAVSLYCHSRCSAYRALELLDAIFEPYGMTKGDAAFAVGNISGVLLSVLMDESGCEEETEFFLGRISESLSAGQIIHVTGYAQENAEEIARLPFFRKKKVPWSFVRTTDIAPAGTPLGVRTLENDTGITVVADADTYIMIGCMGEVYDIAREKFEKSYEETEEPLDIFREQMEFIPAIELKDTGEFVAIDELAHLCYAKPGSAIRAKELSCRTKVFAKDSTEYFIGKKGDYLAVRQDDPTDMYIIQREVFNRTYEEKDEEMKDGNLPD